MMTDKNRPLIPPRVRQWWAIHRPVPIPRPVLELSPEELMLQRLQTEFGLEPVQQQRSR